MTQTVSFKFRDSTGSYDVTAAINRKNVILLEIEDEYGTDCDINDWSPAEQYVMMGLAKKAQDELEYDDDNAPVDSWEQEESSYED
jgi:hypothetical protein